ncbi:uncharacterized protein METZ01_LOCUS491198, partial [marine metagenome]
MEVNSVYFVGRNFIFLITTFLFIFIAESTAKEKPNQKN